MLTTALLGFGVVLLLLSMFDLTRIRLTPAILYLGLGYAAGALLGAPSLQTLQEQAPVLVVATEFAVLVSLFGVGLHLRVPPSIRAWRVALLMAGPGMLLSIVLTMGLALALGMPWAAALLLAAICAPTDPVLASAVQIRSPEDRDAVRLSLTAEGGLNDGTALPAVMLGLALLGLHEVGPGGIDWWWSDLLWPIGGGALIGIATGWLLGRALLARVEAGDRVVSDELVYVGAVALAYGVARATQTSAFIVMFAVGVVLLRPFHKRALDQGGDALSERLAAFGGRLERLVEAASVVAVGVGLHSVDPTWTALVFGAALSLVVRPLAVYGTVRGHMLTSKQRHLVAWFSIRGIGTLFYLMFAIEHGVAGMLAAELISASLAAIAMSIVLHGVSARPLMDAYQRRRSSGKQAGD